VSLLAVGKSTAVNSTVDSIRLLMKFTFRGKTVKLGDDQGRLMDRQSETAWASAGRSFRLPDSISVTSSTIFHRLASSPLPASYSDDCYTDEMKRKQK
jgi:hypothetical protein